jgi:hypothetical protein
VCTWKEDPIGRQDPSDFLKIMLGIWFQEMGKDRRREGEIDCAVDRWKDHFRCSQFSGGIVGA